MPGLRALALSQHGVVRRDQLAALGVTHEHIRSHVAAERWTTYGARVVVLKSGLLSPLQRRCVAVAHAGPPSALGGRTALETLGLGGWPSTVRNLLVPHGFAPPKLAGVVAHQTRHLEASDVIPDVWPTCATAARAAVDAARWEPHPRTASGLVLAVAQRRLAAPVDMLAVMDRIGPVRHARLLRSVLAAAVDGAESRAEVDLAALVRRAGLGTPRRQVVVATPDGPRRVDLAVDLPDGRTLVIEVDGVHHDDPRVKADDVAKDAALVAEGYVVLRVPVWLLRQRPESVLDQLVSVAAAARRRAS